MAETPSPIVLANARVIDPERGLEYPLYKAAVLGCRHFKERRLRCEQKWNDVFDAQTTYLPGHVDSDVRFRSICAAPVRTGANRTFACVWFNAAARARIQRGALSRGVAAT